MDFIQSNNRDTKPRNFLFSISGSNQMDGSTNVEMNDSVAGILQGRTLRQKYSGECLREVVGQERGRTQ